VGSIPITRSNPKFPLTTIALDGRG